MQVEGIGPSSAGALASAAGPPGQKRAEPAAEHAVTQVDRRGGTLHQAQTRPDVRVITTGDAGDAQNLFGGFFSVPTRGGRGEVGDLAPLGRRRLLQYHLAQQQQGSGAGRQSGAVSAIDSGGSAAAGQGGREGVSTRHAASGSSIISAVSEGGRREQAGLRDEAH